MAPEGVGVTSPEQFEMKEVQRDRGEPCVARVESQCTEKSPTIHRRKGVGWRRREQRRWDSRGSWGRWESEFDRLARSENTSEARDDEETGEVWRDAVQWQQKDRWGKRRRTASQEQVAAALSDVELFEEASEEAWWEAEGGELPAAVATEAVSTSEDHQKVKLQKHALPPCCRGSRYCVAGSCTKAGGRASDRTAAMGMQPDSVSARTVQQGIHVLQGALAAGLCVKEAMSRAGLPAPSLDDVTAGTEEAERLERAEAEVGVPGLAQLSDVQLGPKLDSDAEWDKWLRSLGGEGEEMADEVVRWQIRLSVRELEGADSARPRVDRRVKGQTTKWHRWWEMYLRGEEYDRNDVPDYKTACNFGSRVSSN